MLKVRFQAVTHEGEPRYLLGEQLHHKLRRGRIGPQRWAEHVAGRVMPALVRVVRPIGAEGRGQRFAVDADPVVTAASTCKLNAGRLAHHMHHVQGTLGLPVEGTGCKGRVGVQEIKSTRIRRGKQKNK